MPIDRQFVCTRHYLVQLFGALGEERSVLVNLILRRIGIQLAGRREVSQEHIFKQLHLVRRLLWVCAIKYTDDFYLDLVLGWMLVIGVVLIGLQLNFTAQLQVVGLGKIFVHQNLVRIVLGDVPASDEFERLGPELFLGLRFIDADDGSGVAKLFVFLGVIAAAATR